MLAWLAPVVVFGLVIFVHELGHFLAAKAMGVYAPRFSIGFGPALWRKRWGETEYVLAALPLGGYVRMASRDDETVAFIEGGGEHPAEVPTVSANDGPKLAQEHITEGLRPDEYDPEALAPFGPKPVPPHRWFEAKALPARLFILLAGVTMNVLLTLVVLIGSYTHYGQPYIPAVVDSVLAGRPAERAGLLPGDSIIAVQGTPVRTWNDLVDRIGASAGQSVTLDVVRAGQPARVLVQPELTGVPDPITGEQTQVGRIGAAPTLRIERDALSFPEAVARGWEGTWRMGGFVLRIVQGLFSGTVGMDNLGGPIAIAQTSVEAARGGMEQFVGLLAFLSINIAILNLLPIPILDGGQIVLNIAESVKGSPFSIRTREMIARVGLAAIVLLFAVVMFNDIRRLVLSAFG